MKTLTLCGSMRFAQQMQTIALELELCYDYNILQCVYDSDALPITEKGIEALAAAHCRKIALSDGIYVVDIGGYIGNSVRSEIAYAQSLGKEVLYHTAFTRARVTRMEALYDEALRTHPNPDPQTLRTLSGYMESGLWRLDYERDERGEFPPDLKRGVLSQDGLYDLLTEYA